MEQKGHSKWASISSFILHIVQIGIIVLIFHSLPSQTIHTIEGDAEGHIQAIHSIVSEIKSDVKTIRRLENDYNKVEDEIDKIEKVKDDIHNDFHKIKTNLEKGKYKNVISEGTSDHLKGAIDKAIKDSKKHWY